MFASFACLPFDTRGRLYPENTTPYRNEFERDRDRIIHSNAFKRLQYKTQVFINFAGDHYRNRLTHSIEVASIARSIAKALSLSEHLAECIALAHDLGHAPFGHGGEETLNECVLDYGGFAHNTHTLKILTKLERKYAAYEGLNLSWEVLEGIVKHNGPIIKEVPKFIFDYNAKQDLDLANYSSAEAQVASLADDIAYICHDLEDSIESKILDFSDLRELGLINQYITVVKSQYPNIDSSQLIYEAMRKLTHYFINDLLKQTTANIQQQKLESAQDVRRLNYQLVDFSVNVKKEIDSIKKFLYSRFYKHSSIDIIRVKCQKIIEGLFIYYMNHLDVLPSRWRSLANTSDITVVANVISDYIAGMTDRFATNEYQSIYNLSFDRI